MVIHEVLLKEIDAENETFRISENLDPPFILDSLREIGQMNPVLLIEQNGRNIVVCGFRRVRAMKRLGKSKILARILPEGSCEPVRVLTTALWDNLAHRQLNPLEAARVLFRLRDFCRVSDETLIKVYLPLLSLSPAEHVLRSHLLLHQIHPGLRQCLVEGRLTYTSIDTIARMSYRAQDHLAGLMHRIRLSASLQKKLLELLLDLGTLSGNEPHSPLKSQEVVEITEDARLSPFQRGEKVYEVLYRCRNPRLVQATDRFQSSVKQLGLPGPIRVRAYPFFEEPGLRVEFDAPDVKRFREFVSALHQAAQSSELEELFVVK